MQRLRPLNEQECYLRCYGWVGGDDAVRVEATRRRRARGDGGHDRAHPARVRGADGGARGRSRVGRARIARSRLERRRGWSVEHRARAPSAVPDVLAPGLDVVFCGINPGFLSDAEAAHFANPRNDFWRLLHAAGFTPRLVDPSEQLDVLRYRIGITNAAYRPTRAAVWTSARVDFAGSAERLERLAGDLRRRAQVALRRQGGLSPARRGDGRSTVCQDASLGETLLFVLPSTSARERRRAVGRAALHLVPPLRSSIRPSSSTFSRTGPASRTRRTGRRVARPICGRATSSVARSGSSGSPRAQAARDRLRRQGGLSRPFGGRPEHGLQKRRLGETLLFVLPSTSARERRRALGGAAALVLRAARARPDDASDRDPRRLVLDAGRASRAGPRWTLPVASRARGRDLRYFFAPRTPAVAPAQAPPRRPPASRSTSASELLLAPCLMDLSAHASDFAGCASRPSYAGSTSAPTSGSRWPALRAIVESLGAHGRRDVPPERQRRVHPGSAAAPTDLGPALQGCDRATRRGSTSRS